MLETRYHFSDGTFYFPSIFTVHFTASSHISRRYFFFLTIGPLGLATWWHRLVFSYFTWTGTKAFAMHSLSITETLAVPKLLEKWFFSVLRESLALLGFCDDGCLLIQWTRYGVKMPYGFTKQGYQPSLPPQKLKITCDEKLDLFTLVKYCLKIPKH